MPISPDNFADPPRSNQTRRENVKRKNARDEQARKQAIVLADNAPFTADYKEACFHAWYKHDKPRGPELQKVIPEDEHGRKAKNTTLLSWRRGENGWNVRAKELDIEVREHMDDLIIMRRIEMFERHAEAGAQLVDQGLDYLENFDITSDSVAIKAIKEGSDLERKSLGIDELLKTVATMSDKQLEKRAEEIAEAEAAEKIVEEEIIDGVLTDVMDDGEEY